MTYCTRYDCFGNARGHCTILRDTYKDPFDCSFYKTEEQVEEGRLWARRRMQEVDMFDELHTRIRNESKREEEEGIR